MGKPVRIAAVIPQYAPGHCGVTDYVLAAKRALLEHGMVIEPLVYNSSSTTEVDCPAFQSWKSLKAFIENSQFDRVWFHWIGNQWKVVLLDAFRPITGNFITLHVHELWYHLVKGDTYRLSVRQRGVAILQKWALRSIMRSLAPCEIATTNRHYGNLISSLTGRPTKVLSLFPSIHPCGMEEEITNNGRCQILLFGNLAIDYWDCENCLSSIQSVLSRRYREIEVVAAGKAAPDSVERIASACANAGIAFTSLGLLPADDVSTLMRKSSFLLSPTPFVLASKSSVVTSALVHGLPVLFPRYCEEESLNPTLEGLIGMDGAGHWSRKLQQKIDGAAFLKGIVAAHLELLS